MTDRLVMWDFDGTLAFRPGLWSGCVMEVLEACNPAHGISVDQVRVGLQDGFPWHRADEPHPHPGDAERWWETLEALIANALLGAGVERGECAKLARATRVRFIDPTVGWQLFDDAVPALTALTKAGWTNVIVSNHVPELADLVSGVGLDRHFDRVFTSALVGFDKPNPEFADRSAAVSYAQRATSRQGRGIRQWLARQGRLRCVVGAGASRSVVGAWGVA